MKTIKIKFTDFGENTFREDLITCILRERYNVKLSENPDYLFYSVFSDEHLKYKNCIRIFVTTENLVPDFNLCDYAIGYELMDYGDRYLRFPIYMFDGYRELYKKCLNKHINVTSLTLKNKKEFCSFVYSNGNADPFRTRLFNDINSYKHVNSGGKYMNNINQPKGVDDKLKFQEAHKFSVACENSSHLGYTTEKLIESFAAQTVPIYWGDPSVVDFFNSNAFIFISEQDDLQDIINKIAIIDSDDELYLEMLKAPAILEKKYEIDEWMNVLKYFIYNIFDTPIETAFRRNRVFWGDIYFNKQRKRKKVYDVITLNWNLKLINDIRTKLVKILVKN